jgi:hypothetical protein
MLYIEIRLLSRSNKKHNNLKNVRLLSNGQGNVNMICVAFKNTQGERSVVLLLYCHMYQ